MDEDDPWAEYARLQALADSNHLSDRAWAADEALETILDKIERGHAISAQQADNLLTNRGRKQRERRRLMGQHAHLQCDLAANENDTLEARSELAWHNTRCSNREWRLLVSIGQGNSYESIAKAEAVPEATIKTWVRRVRLKLAA